MKKALLLNSDYTPLHFISDIRAFNLVYKGRAEIIDMGGSLSVWNDHVLRTPNRSLAAPATIRLINRIYRKRIPTRFRKKAIFSRDDWQCQYCRENLHHSNITIDHVQPRSRGGINSWKNCVASCKSCNRQKANRTPQEAGMTLIKTPIEPNSFHFYDGNRGSNWHDDWSIFIPHN